MNNNLIFTNNSSIQKYFNNYSSIDKLPQINIDHLQLEINDYPKILPPQLKLYHYAIKEQENLNKQIKQQNKKISINTSNNSSPKQNNNMLSTINKITKQQNNKSYKLTSPISKSTNNVVIKNNKPTNIKSNNNSLSPKKSFSTSLSFVLSSDNIGFS